MRHSSMSLASLTADSYPQCQQQDAEKMGGGQHRQSQPGAASDAGECRHDQPDAWGDQQQEQVVDQAGGRDEDEPVIAGDHPQREDAPPNARLSPMVIAAKPRDGTGLAR